MAGRIMIRKERDGLFHARPQFVCPGMDFTAPKPEGIGRTPELALIKLVPKMPQDIQDEMNGLDRYDMYNAPEFIHMSDKCVDLDRHKPSMEERAMRRNRFLKEVSFGHVESTWDLKSLVA